jgi:hypothetical protein
LAEEQIVELLLVRLEKSSEFFGQSEGDQVIRDGEQFGLLAGDPGGGVLVAALGTGAVMAGMISEVEMAVVAAIGFTPSCGGATRQNGLDGAPVRKENPVTKAPVVLWPVLGQDCGQLDHRAAGLAGNRSVKSLERGAGLGFADGGEVSVDDGGIEGLVTEVLADLKQADPFFQEMCGVGMTQGVGGGEAIGAAGGFGQAVSRLHGADAHESRRLAHELAQGERAIGPAAPG